MIQTPIKFGLWLGGLDGGTSLPPPLPDAVRFGLLLFISAAQ